METSKLRWNKAKGSGKRFTFAPEEPPQYREDTLLQIAAILGFALLGGWMATDVFYSSDAIGYQFMIPTGVNEFSMERVHTVGDVWKSQINHWHTVNGRFICHFLVQLFCGLLPRSIWAVSNAVVYGYIVWLSGNLHRFIWPRGLHAEYRENPEKVAYGCWIAIFIYLILFPNLDFAPPMQLNYVWGLAIELSYIALFFRTSRDKNTGRGIVVQIGLFIVSFIAGQWNEAYVIPILFGLGSYCIIRRMKLNSYEIVGVIGFLTGALILCFAPGNMVRLGDTGIEKTTLTDFIRGLLFSLWPLIAGLGICYLLFRGIRIRKSEFKSLLKSGTDLNEGDRKLNGGYILFLTALIIGSYLLGLVLHFSSGARVTIGVFLGVFLFILSVVGKTLVRKWGVMILGIIGILSGYWKIEAQISTSRRFEMYDALYQTSEDGRIYVPTEILKDDWRESRFVSFYLTYKKKSEVREAAPIKILPEGVRKVNRDSDYNDIIKLSDRVYLFVRSESRPARFILKRRLGLPGTALTIPISDRELDFDSPSGDISIDTLRSVRLGLYVNERPYVEGVPYMVIP